MFLCLYMSAVSEHTETAIAINAQEYLVLERLALHVSKVFNDNVNYRRRCGIDDKLEKCLRLAKAEYSAEEKKLFAEKGAPEIFMPIADMKRRAALAMFSEIFATPGDKSWSLSTTPVVEVPEYVTEKAVTSVMNDFIDYIEATGNVPDPETAFYYAQDRMGEVMNEEESWAKVRAELMEREVHDRMVEGDWGDAFDQYSGYLSTYGTAVIQGPIPRMKYRKESVRKNGKTKFKMVPKIVLSFEAISPWDCFPSSGARKIEQGDFCIRQKYTPHDFYLFSKMKGKEWQRDNIHDVLRRWPNGGVYLPVPGESLRRMDENSVSDLSGQCVIEAINYFGEVRGSYLMEIGQHKDTEGKQLDPQEYYEVNVIVADHKVIYSRIIEPQIGRMLSKGTFYDISDSWWGDSPAEKCESTQRIANSATRDLVVNMAQSSGPQTVIKDIGRLHPSCSPAQSPWKVWLFESSVMGNNENPLHVFQPDSNIRELLLVFDWAMKQADNDTGIPAYTYGGAMAGGAGRTASGLQMMLENVNRGIKMVVTTTDRDVVRKTVKRVVDWLMLYSEDEHIKGDYEVNPSGVMSLVFREGGSVRRRAFLQLLRDPLVAQTILPSGVAAIVREEVRTLDINPDDVIPSREKLKEMDEIAVIQRQMELATKIAEAQAGGQQLGMSPDGQQQQQQQQQQQIQQDQMQQEPRPAPRPGLSSAMSVGAQQQGVPQ